MHPPSPPGEATEMPSAPAFAQRQASGSELDAAGLVYVQEQIANLDSELEATQTMDIEWRRKRFKMLLLKWHPDKNHSGMGVAENQAQAGDVFKHLLAQRSRYLDE